MSHNKLNEFDAYTEREALDANAETTKYKCSIQTKSPSPPLVNTLFGSILIVTLWIIFIGVQSYMKTAIAAIFRYREGKSLVFMASISLICSVIGSIANFFVVNYTSLFESYEPC